MRMSFASLSLALAGLLAAAVSTAAEPKVTVLATGLDTPTGVAVRPETGEVFVSEGAAGKVIMVAPTGGPPKNVITGFPRDSYGKGPKFDIGPLGLAFIGKDTLVVGDGGSLDGEEYLRIYALSKDAATGALKEQTVYDSKHKLGPILPSVKNGRGEGNFYGVAVTPKGIYVTANGDDTKGWVLSAPLKEGEPGELKTFIPTKERVKVDAPVAITISPKGKLVVGQMGEVASAPDSLLTVYDEATGELELRVELDDVYDIAGLAYAKSGKLYGLDFNWPGTKPGALIQIDATKDAGVEGSAEIRKLLELDKPTAMAFGPDGSLYVTVIGTAEKGAAEKGGKLLKITGDF